MTKGTKCTSCRRHPIKTHRYSDVKLEAPDGKVIKTTTSVSFRGRPIGAADEVMDYLDKGCAAGAHKTTYETENGRYIVVTSDVIYEGHTEYDEDFGSPIRVMDHIASMTPVAVTLPMTKKMALKRGVPMNDKFFHIDPKD